MFTPEEINTILRQMLEVYPPCRKCALNHDGICFFASECIVNHDKYFIPIEEEEEDKS